MSSMEARTEVPSQEAVENAANQARVERRFAQVLGPQGQCGFGVWGDDDSPEGRGDEPTP